MLLSLAYVAIVVSQSNETKKVGRHGFWDAPCGEGVVSCRPQTQPMTSLNGVSQQVKRQLSAIDACFHHDCKACSSEGSNPKLVKISK